MEKKEWYQMTQEEVLQEVISTKEGLTEKEANRRYQKYGKNQLPKKKTDSLLKIFFRQLLDPIVLLLIIFICG